MSMHTLRGLFPLRRRGAGQANLRGSAALRETLLSVGYGLIVAGLLSLVGCRSEYGWWTTESALPVIPTNTVQVTP